MLRCDRDCTRTCSAGQHFASQSGVRARDCFESYAAIIITEKAWDGGNRVSGEFASFAVGETSGRSGCVHVLCEETVGDDS